jgi:hypothetical protein
MVASIIDALMNLELKFSMVSETTVKSQKSNWQGACFLSRTHVKLI